MLSGLRKGKPLNVKCFISTGIFASPLKMERFKIIEIEIVFIFVLLSSGMRNFAIALYFSWT